MPITTDQDPAPASLLKMIRCKCTASSGSNNTCSCRKNGLHCVAACFHCRGLKCRNVDESTWAEEDSAIEDDDEIEGNI